LDGRTEYVATSIQQRPIEKVECLRLGFSRIGAEWTVAKGGFNPTRGERNEFLVQSFGSLAVERQPTQENHARDRVDGLREAGPGEVVENETLRAKPGKQPLSDPLIRCR
jgi:hypothetical protein